MTWVTAEHYCCACAQWLKTPGRYRLTYKVSNDTKRYDRRFSGAYETAAASAEWGADDTAGVRQQRASGQRRFQMLD